MGESDYRERNIEECGYPYKFSIVMAVYNVEEYIREAVDSLLRQDIGFKENVQIILVDDGSPDGSGVICDEYQESYPENIKVIHKENGGVSSARNEGLKYVEGKYVNFFDPDDRLSRNTFRRVYDFFSKNDEYIDIVAIPVYFFEGQRGEHPLNTKFKKGTRIVNLRTEYESILLSTASSFYTRRAVKKMNFDTEIVTAEDAKEIVKILLDKFALGVVHNARYEYRKRNSANLSALQTAKQKKGWYTDYLKHFSLWAIDLCKEKCGFIPNFVQYTIMYDLQWKLREKELPSEILSQEEIEEYKALFGKVLRNISDEIIMGQRQMGVEHELVALTLKYQHAPDCMVSPNDLLFCFQNTNLIRNSDMRLHIDFIHLDKGKIKIEGYYNVLTLFSNEIELMIGVNETIQKCKLVERHNDIISLGDCVIKRQGFVAEVVLCGEMDKCKIYFLNQYRGHTVDKRKITYGKYSPVGTEYKNSYYYNHGWCLQAKGRVLLLTKQEKKIKNEWLFLKELWKTNKKGSRKAVAARMLYHLIKPFVHKKIWLISDKATRADDNGEAFFRYLNQRKIKGISTYFVIGKKTVDYQRIKKIGKVIDHLSWKHKFLYLLADKTISAYSHDEINNPFFEFFPAYRDLLVQCDYVFLQHGIIKDDISKGLNRFHKNIQLFITSAEGEYHSILEGNYAYDKEQVVLTGLPRYDLLYNNPQKIITINPTWRRNLFGGLNSKTDIWTLKKGFEHSDFFIFYMGLITNDRLLKSAEKNGYQIQFIPHSVFFPHIARFDAEGPVKILGTELVYRDVFAHSDLIVTDYSSIAFDFAYLRKPVIYTHFDKDTFFDGAHNYTQGYFDYERDGFGEVEYDLESTIDRIIEYMENGCQLKDKYRERIDRFFAFNDQNNCQRVYEAIQKLKR